MRPSEPRLGFSQRLCYSSTQPTPARCGGSTCLGVVGRTLVPECPRPQSTERGHLQGNGSEPLISGHKELLRGAWLGKALPKTPMAKANFLPHSPILGRVDEVWN